MNCLLNIIVLEVTDYEFCVICITRMRENNPKHACSLLTDY